MRSKNHPHTVIMSVAALLVVALSPPHTFLRCASAHGGPDFVAVNNTRDHGPGSLREAMAYAADDDETQVVFQIPTTDSGYDSKSGIFTIQLLRALSPVDLKGTVFDGLAQTHAYDSNKNGPEICISGSKLPPGTPGLVIKAPGCEVNGLILSGFPGDGIVITGPKAKGCRIQGNHIEGNRGSGVVLSYGASENYIGMAPKPAKKDADDADDNGANDISDVVAPNVIRDNAEDGIRVVGENSVNNIIRGNRLWDNHGAPLRLTSENASAPVRVPSPAIKRLPAAPADGGARQTVVEVDWAGTGPVDLDLYWEAATPGKSPDGAMSRATLHLDGTGPLHGQFQIPGYPAGGMFATATTPGGGTSAPSNSLKLDWLY